MKDYLPDYLRKTGENPSDSRSRDIKNAFSKETRGQIDAFIKGKSSTIGSKSTLSGFENSLIKFFDVVEKPLKEISINDVRHFVGLVNNSGKTKSARIVIFQSLRGFLKDNIKGKTKLENFLGVIKNKRETSSNGRIKKNDLIKPDELELMIRTANNLRDKALIMMLWETAGRPDEVLGLKWKDIIFNDDGLSEVCLFSGKKKEHRTILIKDSNIHLKRWKQEYSFPNVDDDDFIFVGKERNKPLSSGGLTKLVERICNKAGIKKHIFPYLFRHSRLTFMRQKLKTPHYTQFAGHSQRQATNYTHLDTEDLKEALINEIYPTEELSEEDGNKIKQMEKGLNNLLKMLGFENITAEDLAKLEGKGDGMLSNMLGKKVRIAQK